MTTLTQTETNDAKTHNQTLDAHTKKANERLVALREQQEKQLAKLRERVEKAEKRAAEAEGKDERTAEARALVHAVVQQESDRRKCLCGCGANTPRAFFVPGHDARLLAATVRELAAEAR